MIIQALAGPGATLLQLPRGVCFSVCALSGALAGALLGFGSSTAGVGVPELLTLIFSLSFCLATAALMLASNVPTRLEDGFDTLPWKAQFRESTHCPFTGGVPDLHCCICSYAAQPKFFQRSAATLRLAVLEMHVNLIVSKSGWLTGFWLAAAGVRHSSAKRI